MTGNLQLLRNFIEKFMGTVCFGNDHFAVITGYGDYVQDNLMICHVYYVEGLGHNLFSSFQTIHMLGKKPNKVYDHFLKAGLGYQNPKHLKKAIAAQPKLYNGDSLHNANLIIDSPDLEETLEDAEEIRLKMRNKMVQINL
uniref:Integrase, catalytic region, zinc finger, CCHC-type, peptidase aspartic, catalytic n=1 Tax=Tanacetum cinerariifolium TaxID=118510 RepID=A0A699JEB6_TANCI|nr:integrase, catalytic region, zinc finger, CCHC-type, peptidase aspartic, catalytic [Tanacetum cinerariifolium]